MQTSKYDNQNINLNSILQVLLATVSLITIATSFYFLVCFSFIYMLARNLDMTLLLYVSIEDYLKAGIGLNIFIVIMLALMISIFTPLYSSISNNTDSYVFIESLKEWLNDHRNKTWLPSIITFAVVIGVMLMIISNADSIDTSLRETASMWQSALFWMIAAAAVLFNVLFLLRFFPLKVVFLVPIMLMLVLIVANMWTGHRVAEQIRQSHANIMIDQTDTNKEPIIGSLVMPVDKGIIYIPADLCNPPTGKHIHIISWSAASVVENISTTPRDCPPPPDAGQPPAP